ncbi:leucine-rich repeat domain-containing protein [Acinetobacter dispersus]|uniref:leucine-rich repeat domain-containing protein n=1 Tax=Acinetobacter dispersus TaxID=70348 RepID=UPI00132EA283|nr:leucine-rich repeat domain-containing protein [Acinetobacter dispersus]QHH99232.1 leucine-rich repeat domain-containing protein [Acinetobacter dispersus]
MENLPASVTSSVTVFPDPINVGIYTKAEVTYRNISNLNVRFRLKKILDGLELYGANTNTNPTLYRFSDGNFSVCLSGAIPPEPAWDIKYLVNGSWIYELTGETVLETEARLAYRDLATELVFNSNVKTVAANTFRFWNKLNKITFNNGLQTISHYAFSDCSALVNLKIPDSVQTIGNNTFSACNAIVTLDLGAGLSSIDAWAFVNLYNLRTLIFRSILPPAIDGNAWGNGGSSGTHPSEIYVPDGQQTTYEQTDYYFFEGKLKPLSSYIPT